MKQRRPTRGWLTASAAALATAAATVLVSPAGAAVSTAGTGDLTSIPVTLLRAADGAVPRAQPAGSLPAGTAVASPELRPDAEAEAGLAAMAAGRRARVNRSFAVRPTEAGAAAAAAATRPPVVEPTDIRRTGVGLGQSFEGLNLFQERFANNGNQFTVEPPDQGLCVGNGFVFESVNGVVRVLRTSGAPVTNPIDINTFYGYPAAVDRTRGRFGPFVTDPTCLYDVPTGRFFNVVLTLDVEPETGAFTGANTLDLAVSRTSNPLDGFNIYSLPVQNDGTQGTPTHRGCPCIGDFPHIGADANGLFITTNEFPFFTSGFNGAQVYGFDKRALARGAARVRGQLFQTVFVPQPDGSRQPGFTVWPAVASYAAFDARDNGSEHFLSTTAVFEADTVADTVVLWSAKNTRSLATGAGRMRLQRAALPSERYGVPPAAEQKVGPTPLRDCIAVGCFPGIGPQPEDAVSRLDSSDSRILGVWYAAGKVWGTAGTSAIVGGNLKAAVAHFEVDPAGFAGNGAVVSQGYVAVRRNNLTYPTVGVLPSGRGVIGFTLVGQDFFPSAGYVAIGPDGSTGQVQVAAVGAAPQDGFSGYRFFSDPPRPRWGDYGAASVSGGKVWLGTEYIANSCAFLEYRRDPTCGGERAPLGNWSTRISAVTP